MLLWLLMVLVIGCSWSWPICPNRSSTGGKMLLWLLMVLVIGCSWSWPICPNRSSTGAEPRFTKPLGEFDYVAYDSQVAIQCCSEGVDSIKWYRLENGQWKSFPQIQPGISNTPKLEEDNQVLRILDADFKDNTTFKCELEQSKSGQGHGGNEIVLQHQLQLFVVACDPKAGGPILTLPFPKDQYIQDFGGNVTIPCSGYFGCSEEGHIQGDAVWLVKQNGRYDWAVNVDPRYRVSNYSTNPGRTMKKVDLKIYPIMPEDLGRTFICKVTNAQVPASHMSQSVRIYKKPGPVDIPMLISIAVGGVLVLVLVIIIVKTVVGKLWGPQIKWYFRSRVSFVGPKPVEDQNKQLEYNAFLYHDEEDTRKANELKKKLAKQGFEISLSSDLPPGGQRMAEIQKESCKSAVVIFLYTENLWTDAFSQFLFQCVVEYRKGKGILILEIEKFVPEKALDETKKVSERIRRKDNNTDLSISVEQDGAHGNNDDEIQKLPDKKEQKIDVKFWKALPRLKVPANESSPRVQKNFQCAIQNRLPKLKSQISDPKVGTSTSKRSDSNRQSASKQPLLEENQMSASPGFSPTSDEVFLSDNEMTKFAFDNEATNISRNASRQDSQQDALQGYSQSQAAAINWQPFISPQFQNEAGVSHPMRVSADIHQSNEVPSIFPKKNGNPKIEAEVHEINETENEFLNTGPNQHGDTLNLDSLNTDQTGLPSENGVFTLSGDQGNHLPEDQSERLESGFGEENVNPVQLESQTNTGSISQNMANAMNIETSGSKMTSSKKRNQSSLQNQNSDDSDQLDFSPGAHNSLASDQESGYVTSPTTVSIGSSPEGLMGTPFPKIHAQNTGLNNSITA